MRLDVKRLSKVLKSSKLNKIPHARFALYGASSTRAQKVQAHLFGKRKNLAYLVFACFLQKANVLN